MRALIAHREGGVRLVEEAELGPPGDREVIVRVSHTALTLPEDLATIAAAPTRTPKGAEGLPLGRSVTGILDAVGSHVRDLKPGLRVATFGAPYVHHATALRVPGPLVVELPKKVNHEEGAFIGHGATALHLFRTAQVSLGETLLVFGAGMMGNLVAQIARAAGVNAILVDDSEHRLARARNVGITNAMAPNREQLVAEVARASDNEGADAALITPDAPAGAVDWAALMLRWKGRLLITGTPAEPLTAGRLLEKEAEVRIVQSAGAGMGEPAYERAGIRPPRAHVRWMVGDNMRVFLNLLADRKVQISPLISERTPFERAAYLYERLATNPSVVVGAVLTV